MHQQRVYEDLGMLHPQNSVVGMNCPFLLEQAVGFLFESAKLVLLVSIENQ